MTLYSHGERIVTCAGCCREIAEKLVALAYSMGAGAEYLCKLCAPKQSASQIVKAMKGFIQSAPKPIEIGQRIGSLTILRRNPSGRYTCGCQCGRRENYRARALLTVRACSRCMGNK